MQEVCVLICALMSNGWTKVSQITVPPLQQSTRPSAKTTSGIETRSGIYMLIVS